MNTAVFKLFGSVLPVTLTHYGSDHRGNFSGVKTHDFTKLRSNVVSAGYAEVTFLCFALGKGGGITVAAGIAAGAAVCAGQTGAYLLRLFVNGNGEHRRGNGKTDAGNKTDCGNDYNGNKYIHFFVTLLNRKCCPRCR